MCACVRVCFFGTPLQRVYFSFFFLGRKRAIFIQFFVFHFGVILAWISLFWLSRAVTFICSRGQNTPPKICRRLRGENNFDTNSSLARRQHYCPRAIIVSHYCASCYGGEVNYTTISIEWWLPCRTLHCDFSWCITQSLEKKNTSTQRSRSDQLLTLAQKTVHKQRFFLHTWCFYAHRESVKLLLHNQLW